MWAVVALLLLLMLMMGSCDSRVSRLRRGRSTLLFEQQEHPPPSPEKPLFLIAGTQKSGTTAMAAYLSLHPNISMSAKKELHFFDKDRVYNQGIGEYLRNFDISADTVVIGEATPFYIASRKACQRIQKHFPESKLIVLLREPVDRAYSEYQMKVRRVEECNHFIQLLIEHQAVLFRCMLRSREQYSMLRECLPAVITEHGRYNKLVKALKNAMKEVDDWSQVVNNCFPIPITSLRDLSVASVGNSSFSVEKTKKTQPLAKRVFDASRCWMHYKEGIESVNPVDVALLLEARELSNCLGNSTANDRPLNRTAYSQEATLQRLQSLNKAVDQCVKVSSGISKQYIYRSLYAVQIFHCLKSIDRSRMMFLSSAELKDDLANTMRQILRFLQLPESLQWLPALDRQDAVLQDIVQDKFAAFEKTTSWRLKSEYIPLSNAHRNELHRFFQPHNLLLHELLDSRFPIDWT